MMPTRKTSTPPTSAPPAQGRKLGRGKAALMAPALLVMVAVCVAGGYGTYHNVAARYGSATAVGVVGAGEGGTAVLALLVLGLTILGQSTPLLVRLGLWVLPAVAAAMCATAATEVGQTLIYAATPMAITAGAEGLAFLVRRIVIYQQGEDADALARNADTLRALAYHQARAHSHPWTMTRRVSALRSWRLARRVGHGDVTLGADLVRVQRDRISDGASAALTQMYTPSADTSAKAVETPKATTPALPAASADDRPASKSDATTPVRSDATIQADTSGHPTHTPSDQGGDDEKIRPTLAAVPAPEKPQQSMAQYVRTLHADGTTDIDVVVPAVAARYGRDATDKTLRSTVSRYLRNIQTEEPQTASAGVGHYL